jgi:nucleoside-triphosphatase THEP1
MAMNSRIAAVVGADSAFVQDLFASLVASWRASGGRIVGLLGEIHEVPDRTCRAGTLRDIVSGDAYPIFLEKPSTTTSCLIDAGGVEAAAAALLPQVSASDLVVLSKFGKVEAAHRGLATVLEAAIAAGKPVLTSVSEKHRDAWREFAPEAVPLAADASAIIEWWHAVTA